MIEIEETQWPMVTVTFSGKVTAAEMAEYLTAMERYHRSDDRYIGLVSIRDLKPPDASIIRIQADWVKKHEAQLRKQSLGVALVLPSLWMVGMVRAVLWIQPMPQPYFICASVDEAMPWLQERLRLAGINTSVRNARVA